jgi:tellurite resistance protein TerC
MIGVQRMEITTVHWVVFIVAVLFFLALDLGVFHREARKVRFKEALAWSGLWASLALLFGSFVSMYRGFDEGTEFITGYIIEVSLSMDNVFVIALIFSFFRVPTAYQHRVLFWGIMGALVMRLVMILAGAALISRFYQVLYLFGAFLVYTGVKMLVVDDEGVEPEKNPCIRLARKWFRVSNDFDGQKFVTMVDGKKALTPLALVLVMIETTDLIFALDSIPAIFAVTQKEFIVFTSNVFAILGLRSLYFVLANAIEYFRYLKYGLSLVLVFIGGKMLAEWWHVKIDTLVSLYIVAAIITGSVILSFLSAREIPDNGNALAEDFEADSESGDGDSPGS